MHLVIYLPLLVPLAAAAARPRLPLVLPRGAVTRHG
jgi:hypothetical protein